MTYISSCLSQKQLAEKFAFTNHSSRSSVANSSSATSAHIVRDMLTQIMNDQVFMKEQLLRLNAVHSSSSAAKSASSSSASSSPTVVDDVLTDDEFVDNYDPVVKGKAAKKKRSWSDSSLKLLAALKNEQSTVDQARISTSIILLHAFFFLILLLFHLFSLIGAKDEI